MRTTRWRWSPTPPTCAPARACTASSTRWTSEVYLYTQFESADARRVFACFDQPDLKATFAFSVTAPDALAGGLQRADAGAQCRSAPAWRRGPSRRRPRLSTYITALVAGPYHVVRDDYVGPHGTYPLGVFCRPVAGRSTSTPTRC